MTRLLSKSVNYNIKSVPGGLFLLEIRPSRNRQRLGTGRVQRTRNIT